MKRLLIALTLLMLCCTPVNASYMDNFTNDTQIKHSLNLLSEVNASEVFENLSENAVTIKFFDLKQLSYNYTNCYAINTIDNLGNRVILINSKYKNASTEELACIIAHESCHTSNVASLEEETYATELEAYYWCILKNNHRVYEKTALNDRLENLSKLYLASSPNNKLIKQKISNSSFYKQQLAIAK